MNYFFFAFYHIYIYIFDSSMYSLQFLLLVHLIAQQTIAKCICLVLLTDSFLLVDGIELLLYRIKHLLRVSSP